MAVNVGEKAGYSTGSGGAASVADFSTSLAAWREIQLPTLQASLNTHYPTLIEAQKDALLSRKKLAEQTREFKKLSADAQPEAIKPLLKAYQGEIDSLTKRAKTAENALLSVHDRLQNASDPYPILELVLEQTAVMGDVDALKATVKQLQAGNATLETQVASLPALEADRTRLTSRLAQFESSASEMRKKIEAELSAKWDERIRNYTTREENLTKSLETSQVQLKELRANYAKVTERLLHHGEQVEREHTNGEIGELDMISEELSRSNERAAAMERRNEQLRQEMERLKSGLGEDQRIIELERRAYEAEEENRRLSKLLEEEGKKTSGVEEQVEAKRVELERSVKEKEQEIEGLRTRLRRMSDYDEIKRELDIVKYVEFAVESDRRLDDEDEDEQQADRSTSSTAAKPLEALLIEKNRHLQDEVTSFRVANSELTTTVEQARKDLLAAQGEAMRLKKLNERLEDDLLNVKPDHAAKSTTRDTASMSAEQALAEMDSLAGASSTSAANAKAGKSENITADVSAGAEHTGASTRSSATAAPSTGASTSSSSILPIITSQRDRFRARNAELEEELRKQFAAITELRNEVKTLQADNLGLYEKVRYLQAYNASGSLGTGSAAAGRSNISGGGGGARMVNMTAAVSARNDYGGHSNAYPPTIGEDKYREKYEASMNPFEQFRGREQSRALSALNPLERLLHMVTRVVLGHRRMRIFFVVYALCLHLLVFAMLFEVEFATGSSSPVRLDGVTPASHGAAP